MSSGPSGATPEPKWPDKRGYRFVEAYDYRDEDGRLLRQNARYECVGDPGPGNRRKVFLQRWPNGSEEPGPFVYKAPGGVRSVVYRMAEVLAVAEAAGDVWWVEGEKDADNLSNLGLTATTLGGTTARIPDDFPTQVKGIERLFVIPDNDDPGRLAAVRVAAAAHDHVGQVRIVELDGLAEHGDVTDFLSAGRSVDELYRAADACPRWTPSPVLPDPGRGSERKTGPTNELLTFAEELIEQGSLELFHDQEGAAFATISPPVSGSVLTFEVEARAFASHLEGGLIGRRADRGEKLRVITASARADALRTLEAIAIHHGEEQEVYLRLARNGNSIVLDLADATGEAVNISPDGWQIVDRPSVRFRRSKTMRGLPRPVSGGDLGILRSYVHVSDDDYPLAIAWLISAMSGKGPNPLAVIYGEQGSGKSTTAKILRGLVDPAVPLLRALPHDERTLVIGAHTAHVLGFDNLSGIDPIMSDALCRIASGEGFAVRQLYSNREEEVFGGARPIILTGIEEAASRPDLLDRSFLIEAERTSASDRREETELVAAFDADRPVILGVLLDGLVAALRNEPSIELTSSHRMVDAARMAQAAEVGLRLPPGTIREATERASVSATSVALDASPIAQAVIAWFAQDGRRPWSGTAGELLNRLDAHLVEGSKPPRGWPTTPRGLSSALTRVVPSLRNAGIPIEHLGPKGSRRKRLWEIGGSTDQGLAL